jgi:hypothetical protein
LPRIGVRSAEGRPGEFYVKATGTRFVPRGFNHTVLEQCTSGWHATFNIGAYDAEAMEKTLSTMAGLGANVIRVWAWGVQKEGGFTDQPEGDELNARYMENFVDFLRRATAHGIYVIPILDEVPQNGYYASLAQRAAQQNEDDPKVTGYNRQYLCRGPLAAKTAAAQTFVRYIKEADAALLSTVLGWALANEVFVNFTEGPFSDSAGIVKTNTGKRYDMAEKHQRQACYDESIRHWANTLADAIRHVDPEALVTAGMWTSDAHSRPSVNGLLPDGRDPRIPPRPSVLGGPDSRLDFIDVHIYPWDGTPKVRPEAHEREAVTKAALVGEYGVFKDKPADQARTMMSEMLDQAYRVGYAGDLLWIWDLTGVPGQTWSAVEEDIGKHVMDWPGGGGDQKGKS